MSTDDVTGLVLSALDLTDTDREVLVSILLTKSNSDLSGVKEISFNNLHFWNKTK